MPYYIKLNADDVAESVTQTHSALSPAADLVEVDDLREELLGKRYDRQASTPTAPVFVDVPAATVPQPEWTWYIDQGPFTDRLGPTAIMSIDTSTIPALIAIRADFARRRWIDLKDPRVIAAVRFLSGEQPLPVFGTLSQPLLTPAQADAVLNTPVAVGENLALRKLYFGA